MDIINKSYVRGEDKTKAPEKELYIQYDPINGRRVWAFKFANSKGIVTIYRGMNDTENEKKRMEEIVRTGKIEGKGNIYHPENRTLKMPKWLGVFNFTKIGHVQSK